MNVVYGVRGNAKVDIFSHIDKKKHIIFGVRQIIINFLQMQ